MTKNGKYYLVFFAVIAQFGCSREANFTGASAALKSFDANRAPVIKSLPLTQAKPGDPIGNPVAFDLTKWSTVIPMVRGSNSTDPKWTVTSTTAIQEQNAVASILLSDIDSENQKIEGKWTAAASNDDDFMGFVFAYKDARTFYLFDWKKGKQYSLPNDKGVLGEIGMSIKLVQASTDLEFDELWSTNGSVGRVTSLFHNSIPWQYDTQYTFSLNFVSGATSIEIKQGATVIATIRMTDTTLKTGKFGFYNFSQPNISYEGFKQTPVLGADYYYQVVAEDAEADILKYSLAVSPPGMVIDASTGRISWAKDKLIPGVHKVSVVVTDPAGLSAQQDYEVNVSP